MRRRAERLALAAAALSGALAALGGCHDAYIARRDGVTFQAGDAVAANKAMRDTPVAFFGRPATLRADGRLLYDPVLYRVKKPTESKAPWDYYEAVRTIPQNEAFLPMNPACGFTQPG